MDLGVNIGSASCAHPYPAHSQSHRHNPKTIRGSLPDEALPSSENPGRRCLHDVQTVGEDGNWLPSIMLDHIAGFVNIADRQY